MLESEKGFIELFILHTREVKKLNSFFFLYNSEKISTTRSEL
jgi:hypothetical protein